MNALIALAWVEIAARCAERADRGFEMFFFTTSAKLPARLLHP